MSFIKFSERKRRVSDFEANASVYSLLRASSLGLPPRCISVVLSMSVSYLTLFLVQLCILSTTLYITGEIAGMNTCSCIANCYSTVCPAKVRKNQQ